MTFAVTENGEQTKCRQQKKPPPEGLISDDGKIENERECFVMTTTMTTYVPRTNYRRGADYAKKMGEYIKAVLDPECEFMLTRLQRVLVRAMREDITAREAQCLELYYAQGFNYRQISGQLHINVSTIPRNIQRGERKLNRVLDLGRAIAGQEVI